MAKSPAERQRQKREKDYALVWDVGADETQLSDTALLEQIAIAYRKGRNVPGENAILQGLIRELMKRARLVSA
jgi:hypothetical protein